MLISNTANGNIIPNSYANGKNNVQSSMRNLSSVSSSSTIDLAGIKIDQVMQSEAGSTTKALQNTENSISSSSLEKFLAGKFNDQVSLTKSCESGQCNLYTASAKLKETNLLPSGNAAKATDGNGANSLSSEAIATNTTNSSAVDLAGQTKEVLSTLSKAPGDLSTQKAGVSGRMEETRRALLAYEDNIRSAESKIRDIDMSRQSDHFTKYQVLSQASNAMLGQANQTPGNVLSLLS